MEINDFYGATSVSAEFFLHLANLHIPHKINT